MQNSLVALIGRGLFACLTLFALVTSSLTSANDLPAIKVVTTEFPPYSYREHGTFKGTATEVVNRAIEASGLEVSSLRSYPWARTYELARDEPNTLIYSIARTPEREELFHWVGTIAPFHVNLYRLKQRQDVQVQTLEEAKSYLVGGEYQDVKQAYLVKQGFVIGKNIILSPNDENNIRMLFAGRIDLLPFNAATLPIMLEQLGLDPDAVEPVLNLEEISFELYMAFNINTPIEVVERLRTALASIKEQ